MEVDDDDWEESTRERSEGTGPPIIQERINVNDSSNMDEPPVPDNFEEDLGSMNATNIPETIDFRDPIGAARNR